MVFSFHKRPVACLFEEPVIYSYEITVPPKKRCPAAVTKPQAKESAPKPKDLKLALHLGNFKPEDVKVSLTGHTLTIEGNQSSSSSSGSSYSSSFRRLITLGENIDMDTVQCKMNEKGMLEISAKPRPAERQIEIHVEKAAVTDAEKLAEATSTERQEKPEDQNNNKAEPEPEPAKPAKSASPEPILEPIGPDDEADSMK